MAKSIGAFMHLHEVNHVRLKHKWVSMDGLRTSRVRSKLHPYAHVGESGLPIYETVPCRSRGCWACQHKARRKLRSKVDAFVQGEVLPKKRAWRFVTLTLPGTWYPVRHDAVEAQLKTVKRAFVSWRLKMLRRGHRVHGFWTIEFEGGAENTWHTHIHMIMRWKHGIDYTEVKRLWTESVDRRMRKQLATWTENSFTNDQRVVQVDPISHRGIAEYCTKVTNYVTKGPKKPQIVSEIGKMLYRKRTVGWLGEYHGSKKEANGAGSSIPPV